MAIPTHHRTFSYIPDGLKGLRLDQAQDHEYWGEDFAAGKAQFALFRRENGRRVVVCTYGDWSALAAGQSYGFQHTQTFRNTELEFECVLPKDVAVRRLVGGPTKARFWTLK